MDPEYSLSSLAEIIKWAKANFPGRSFEVSHLEANRYVVVVKGEGKVLREVLYVKAESTATPSGSS